MEIIYDPNKDLLNIKNHGISLAEAKNLNWNLLLTEQDYRHYDEIRMIGYAPIEPRLFCVVYTDKGDIRRIISLRKANRKEVKRYANKI